MPGYKLYFGGPCVDGYLTVRQNQGKGGVKWIGPCLITLVHPKPLFDVSYRMETSELLYQRVSPQFLKVYNGEST